MYLDTNNGIFLWFYPMLTNLLIARLVCKLTHKVGTIPVMKVHRPYID